MFQINKQKVQNKKSIKRVKV